jgi:endonuclease/exonuclease/phosphatase family metal-dependent hydrolase
LIYDIIIDEDLDVLALQEVLSQKEFEKIRKNLPMKWTGAVYNSDKGNQSRFGFAFFWNTLRFEECSEGKQPLPLNNYKSETHLEREPFYGRFAPVGVGAFQEYRLLNIHLTSSSHKIKKTECETLFGEIYNEVDTRRYGNNRPAVTVALGDYNYSVTECDIIAANVSIKGGYPNIATVLSDLTHIYDYSKGYNSSLDHFCYNNSKYKERILSYSRVDAVDKYFYGNFEEYTKKISDHVPVIIELA